jgi:hypothetical protein
MSFHPLIPLRFGIVLTGFLSSSLWGQGLIPDPASGKVNLEPVAEYIEGNELPRVDFVGDLQARGEPPIDFHHSFDEIKGASLTFRNRLISNAAFGMWVYTKDDGARFSAAYWNGRLTEWIAERGREASVTLLATFRDGLNSGPVVLNYTSMEAEVQVVIGSDSPDTQQIYGQRFIVVPVEEQGVVILLAFESEARVYDALVRHFVAFAKSLYLLE